jgi:hypothetical protein
MRALLMSGHMPETLTARGIEAAKLPFVAKPFAVGALATAVRRALDESPAAAPR